MAQTVLQQPGAYLQIESILLERSINHIMLVCDCAFEFLPFRSKILNQLSDYTIFSDFKANPLYEDVVKGVELFRQNRCDAILAIGGGSAIDVAKCIKLFAKMDLVQDYFTQQYKENGILLMALPTTAGTGSESTKFAVIYKNGEKQSVHSESIIPHFAILESSALYSLPLYQKKCTMLDALCQAIESWWSINSNEESKKYSKQAIELILKNRCEYISNNSKEAAKNIMLASNLAGRAINITQTTAPHAMSYKLTSLYGIPHGHAVAVCLPRVWRYMLLNTEKCTDERGCKYLEDTFTEIASVLGCDSAGEAISLFEDMLNELELFMPDIATDEELKTLSESVNPGRMKNNPVLIDRDTAARLYSGQNL